MSRAAGPRRTPSQQRLPGAREARPVLWTIGYEGRTVDDLIATLRGAGVRHLVDVRELPMSRRAGFGKSALSAAVEAAGLRYTGLRELGAPREVRHRVRDDGDWAAFSAEYLAHLDTQGEPLARLAALAKAEPAAVLCYERSAKDCHRGLLAQRMAQQGFAIIDL